MNVSVVLMRAAAFVWMLPRNVAIIVLRLWRRFVSPLYGDVCRFYPTCSAYAVEAYQQRGFVVGTGLVTWRLLRCNPFGRGGVEPVPHRHEGAGEADFTFGRGRLRVSAPVLSTGIGTLPPQRES